jgi:small subunit ribosomal protein S1
MSGKHEPARPSRRPAPTAPVADGQDDFAALFAESETRPKAKKIALGDRVKGVVTAIDRTSVFVAIGDKSEATIDVAEFRDSATGEFRIAVGDVVEATVVDDGERSGSPVLRRTLGRGGHLVAELEQAAEHRVPVEGLVVAETKGGYEVQIGNIRAFCPGSQIDSRRGGERVGAAEYVGKRFQFRVTKVEQDGRNVVVSRRELLEAEAAEAAEKTWAKIHVGAVLEGTVRSVRDFGAFVDLGGVDGMVHVSELGYTRVKHPGEVLSIGQKVTVQVVKIDSTVDNRGRRQIGLSIKALATDPWSTVGERYPIGTTVPGVVRRLESFGAFVEIEPGVEGLVHISKIVVDRRLAHPRQALALGEAVNVTVIAFDPRERRLSLSLVEQAKQARDAEAMQERVEEQRAMAEINQPRTLGTFGDLLSAARSKH